MDNRLSTPTASWVGRGISAIVVLVMAADAAIDLLAPDMVREPMQATGFPMALAPVLGVVSTLCAIVYAIPQTAVLGAILISAFFGAALCTHLRVGELGSSDELICVLVAVLAWRGLYLRDARVRALLPLRS